MSTARHMRTHKPPKVKVYLWDEGKDSNEKKHLVKEIIPSPGNKELSEEYQETLAEYRKPSEQYENTSAQTKEDEPSIHSIGQKLKRMLLQSGLFKKDKTKK